MMDVSTLAFLVGKGKSPDDPFITGHVADLAEATGIAPEAIAQPLRHIAKMRELLPVARALTTVCEAARTLTTLHQGGAVGDLEPTRATLARLGYTGPVEAREAMELVGAEGTRLLTEAERLLSGA